MAKLSIHYHLGGGRVRTIDLSPPNLKAQYQDLLERLMAALSRSGHKTSDDAEGDPTGHWVTMSGAHVFINSAGLIIKGPAHMVGKNKNDMAETAQAKPVEPAKGVKGKVHQLLTTGHLFSFDELKNATGAKLDQQLHNAINELKAGKGAHGQLSIQKVGKHYQVINDKGDPMPGLPKTEPDPFANFKLPAADPALAAKAPDLDDHDAPLEWEPGMPEEMKAEADIVPPTPEPIVAPTPVPGPPGPKVAKAPAEPMSKADADKVYAEAITNASFDAGINVAIAAEKGMDSDEYNAMLEANAKHWKEQKALAMAQWAANYNGGDHSPKPVEVFPADKKLMEALGIVSQMKGSLQEKAITDAMAKWKEDTAKAKAAIKNPPPLNPGKAAAMGMTPVKEDTTPTGGHTLSAPESIVPKDHVGITADDFAPEAGQSQSPYVKDISELHKALHASASANASVNKANVQQGLEKRLKASPHFQTMQEQYAKKMGGQSLASNMIQAWASSSGDHHARSVANQLAIRDVFGMHPDDVEMKAFHIFNNGKTSEEDVYKMAANEYGIQVGTPAKLESFKAGCRDFALAQYHETQDHLKKLGISEVSLVRGMEIGQSTTGAMHGDLKLQPASSFSTAHSTAHQFAGGHSLFVVKVPASQVLSSFVTGFGCTSESEVVVLAHKDMKAIKIGTSHAPNATTMSKNIAEQLGSPSSGKKITPVPSPASHGLADEGGMASEAYTAAQNGDLDTITKMKKDFDEAHEPGLYMKKVGNYVTKLHEHMTEGTKKPTKKADVFKPSFLPPIPAGVAKKKAKAMHDLAKAGDIAGVQELVDNMPANAPNTKKYGGHLLAELKVQHEAHVAALEAKKAQTSTKELAKAMSPAKPVATTPEGVKKNAHYYKKLKEKILAHPLHTEENYKMGKSQGMTNEQILAQLEKIHAQNNKEY